MSYRESFARHCSYPLSQILSITLILCLFTCQVLYVLVASAWNVNVVERVLTIERRVISRVAMMCALAAAGTDIWGVAIWLSVDDLDHLLSSPINQLCALSASPPIRYWWDMRALMLKLPMSTCFTSYNVYSDGWLLLRCCSVKKGHLHTLSCILYGSVFCACTSIHQNSEHNLPLPLLILITSIRNSINAIPCNIYNKTKHPVY